MPHPESPHRSSSSDLARGLDAVHVSKDAFCAPLPLRTPVPLPSDSPRPSVVASTMATAFQSTAPSEDARPSSSHTKLDDPNSIQWDVSGSLPINYLGHDGAGFQLSPQFTPDSTVYYDYDQNDLPYNENYNFTYSAPNSDPSYPRPHARGVDLIGLPSNMTMSESYPPSAYQIEPQRSQEAMDIPDQGSRIQIMQLGGGSENQYASNIKMEEYGSYASPYDSDGTRSSTPHDDHTMPHDFKPDVDDATIDKEQPYAQLIFRALMDAPDHTMILRDIYDWFKKNTDKAADKETKGWQNSIRHNLSMNGAFEKVDQPSEDAKKGFMWRLTDKAIREGVKSTTRYRSKQPNKRGHRAHHPLPQRQASGAKGGQAARRAAKLRRSNRMNETYRSEPYMSRSIAAGDLSYCNHSIPMPYPPSPYCGSEVDFGYPSTQEEFGSAMSGQGLELFSARSYTGSPLPQDISHSDTVIVLPQDPSEPLFTNSPSPTADEPRTPTSQNDWHDDMNLGTAPPFIYDISYREYMG